MENQTIRNGEARFSGDNMEKADLADQTTRAKGVPSGGGEYLEAGTDVAAERRRRSRPSPGGADDAAIRLKAEQTP